MPALQTVQFGHDATTQKVSQPVSTPAKKEQKTTPKTEDTFRSNSSADKPKEQTKEKLPVPSKNPKDKPPVLGYKHFLEVFKRAGYNTPLEMVKAASEKDENSLGGGTEGIVFSIPGIPDYVIKIPHHLRAQLKKNTDGFPEEFSPQADLLAHRNLGQAVAKAGSVEILKRQSGKSVHFVMQHIKQLFTTNVASKQLFRLGNLPQDSFDDLLHQLTELREHGYEYELMGDNLMIDWEQERFKLIDIKPIEDHKKMFQVIQNLEMSPEMSAVRLYKAFVSPSLNYTLSNDLEIIPVSKETRLELKKAQELLFKKCRIAARKAGLPLFHTVSEGGEALKLMGLEGFSKPLLNHVQETLQHYVDQLLKVKNIVPEEESTI